MKAQKFLKYLILLVVAGNLALVAIVFLGGQSPKPTPMPNPNGYDDFVKAAGMVRGNPWDFDTMSLDELRTLVTTNAEALKLMRVGLTQEFRLPMLTGSNYAKQVMGRYGYRTLGFLLMAEARVAEMNGSTNDAAQSYLDLIRMGNECSRGGIMIDWMSGQVVASMGLISLKKTIKGLDAKESSEIAQNLESIDARNESWQEILDREKAFQRTLPLSERLRFWFQELRDANYRHMDQRFETSFLRHQTQNRQAIIAFAARAYRLDKGVPPKTVADLVPGYLKAVPQDPTTGTSLVLAP